MKSQLKLSLTLIILILCSSLLPDICSALKSKNVIKVPRLLFALDIKKRLEEHGISWETTNILIDGKYIKYEYFYSGYHPNPYFKRKIKQKSELTPKDMFDIIKKAEESLLFKKVVIKRPVIKSGNSVSLDLAIKVKNQEGYAKIYGLLSDLKKNDPAAYAHYKNIGAFAGYLRVLATSK